MHMQLLAGQTMRERMIVAVAVSLALHFAVVIGIQGRPNDSGGTTAAPITAHLEPRNTAQADPQPTSAEVPAVAQSEQAPAVEIPAHEPATPTPVPAAQAASNREPSAAVDIPVIRDPTYYAARFLDEYPKPLLPVDLRYPPEARLAKITGNVTLLLLIDEHGNLNELSVAEATPDSTFNEAALAAFRGMRFSPARKDGRAVRSRVLITVDFEAAAGPSSAQ